MERFCFRSTVNVSEYGGDLRSMVTEVALLSLCHHQKFTQCKRAGINSDDARTFECQPPDEFAKTFSISPSTFFISLSIALSIASVSRIDIA